MPYLFGTVITGGIWCVLYLVRKDLRKEMLWSGWYFFFIMTIGFIAMKLFTHPPIIQTINPGYWTPETLFDLNNLTGGYSIEDVFFMFFTGGIAAVLYEELFSRRIRYKHLKHRPHFAIQMGILAGAAVMISGMNLIYSIIAFGYAGAIVIWYQRPDLVIQSLVGGALFLIVYIAAYLAIIAMYPGFVAHTYHMEHISDALLMGIPLEEWLFALGMGVMWSPVYEYIKDLTYFKPAPVRAS